ncbi:LysM peptidoglycan-binding domain-containing protein [Vagococcus luciliae]|uniref:LysM domain-containing protein n=1 Tax=Vagococcus luciliae TaxID=2920380 RepID=A0ABY5P1F3_9ENTE|nr:LysM peptidoglycan-binding domain-containing protein [Vagococcus luciliae]UUV99639.1 hypothetical protein G314FT_18020 [Vagococcus luciliae]
MNKTLKKILFSSTVLTSVLIAGNAKTVNASTNEEWRARSVEEIKESIKQNIDVYTIIKGDTLSAISEASGITIDDLVAWNNIANRDLIYAGNTLIFHANGTVTDTNGNSFTLSEESKAGRAEVKAQTQASNVQTQEKETVNQAVNQQATQGNTNQTTDQKPAQDTGVEQSVTPSKPGNSGVGNDTEKPVVPVLPVNPVVPETPEQPEKPELPVTPELPEVPGAGGETGGETEKPEQPGTGGETGGEIEKPEQPGTGGETGGETEKPEQPGTGGETGGETEKPEQPGTGGETSGETEKPEQPGTGGETGGNTENPVWVPEQVIPEEGHWEDGVKEVWVPNIVTIVDKPAYTETMTYTLIRFNDDGAEFKITAHISTPEGQAQADLVDAHQEMLMDQGFFGSYTTRDVTEEVTHPAVTHTEDHGHYENVPDPDNPVWVVDKPEQVIPGHWSDQPGDGSETEKPENPEQPGTGGETGGETENPEQPGTGGETGGETENPEQPGTGGETGGNTENPVWVPEQVIPEEGHWEDGVKEVWVPNIVTIVDKPAYTETMTYTLITFAADGKQFKLTAHIDTPEGQAQYEEVLDHSDWLDEQGLPNNYSTQDITDTITHPAVTHTEDHGHYENVPDPDNPVWVVDVPEQVIPGHWA